MNREFRRSEIVHDLMHIQQKRMVAYEKALKECCPHDHSVCELLHGMVEQSRQSITELRCHTSSESSEPADRAEIKGDLYRDWPEINYFNAGNSLHEILLCCGYIEKTTTQAYRRALEQEDELDIELKQVIYQQWISSSESFQSVYAYLGRPSAPETGGEERMPCGFARTGVFASL